MKRSGTILPVVVAAAAGTLFLALGGPAVAARGLIGAADIATGAVTSKTIRNGAIGSADLSRKTKASLQGAHGSKGDPGPAGNTGEAGSTGASGVNGANGPNGANGAAGINGANGANGPNGANGVDGTAGENGADGTNGINGAAGVLGPLSATAGVVALPTATPPTVVVSLAVPAGNYVVFAKTQLTHSGAGDTVDCVLKAGTTAIDQVAMKTLPALAAIPVSLQAVTTTSPTQLSLECDVTTANGSASSNSLIAIPVN